MALAVTCLIAHPVGWIQAQTTPEGAATKLAPVTVTAERLSLHDVGSESERVGPAQQPEWTARRAFAETDVYVIPTGEIEFNQFYVLSHGRHGPPEHEFESELEFGLPWRTQIDVEPNYSLEDGRWSYDSTRVEVPHALANWGKIPFNPAIDAGWRFREGESDSFLVRLLLAEEFGQRWHLGANLGYERQVGGGRETDYELNAALSYVAFDRRLSVGAELLVEHETEEGDPSATSIMMGPVILYKPTRNTHLGVVPLFGLTADAPMSEVFFVFGIDFEPFSRWGKSGDDGDKDRRGFSPVRRPR